MIEALKYQVLLASIYIPVFWSLVILFSKLNKNPAKFFLLGLFVNISFVYLMTFLKYNDHFQLYTTMFPVQVTCVLSSFPLFYLYVYSITHIREKLIKNMLFHFILPVIFGFIFLIIMYVFMNHSERLEFISDYLFNPASGNNVYDLGYYFYRTGKFIYVGQSIFYLILYVRLYRQHNKNVKELFSSGEGVDLSWLKSLGIYFLVVFIFNAIIHIIKLKYVASDEVLIIISYIIFNMFFMALGILTLRQKEIYGIKASKYEFQGKEPRVFSISKHDVEKYLGGEKPFLNKDFNIYDMCFHFNTNRTYMSAFINQRFGENFRSLINRYRINETKSLIHHSISAKEEIPLELIALQAGFSSYSTFLRVFKKNEGNTPVEYRNDLIR